MWWNSSTDDRGDAADGRLRNHRIAKPMQLRPMAISRYTTLLTAHIVGKIRAGAPPQLPAGAARPGTSLGIVVAMTGGDDTGADPGADPRGLHGERPWQHPSEVGLAHRGRVDRKRSTLIASGVLLGGIGLLLSGVVLGTMEEPANATTSTLPLERAELSVAHVMADGDPSHAATGVVLDDQGHVLVDGDAVEGVDTVWVRCSGAAQGTMATVVARDAATDLAVLQLPEPSGVPASVASDTPGAGAELRLVRAGERPTDAVTLAATSTTTEPRRSGQLITLSRTVQPRHYLATVTDTSDVESLRGGMVFDRSGRLSGVVSSDVGDDSTVRVLSAADAVGAAEEMLGSQPG